MSIFENKMPMPPARENVVAVDQVPADVDYPKRGRLPGSCSTDNSVQHAERPRRGHDY